MAYCPKMCIRDRPFFRRVPYPPNLHHPLIEQHPGEHLRVADGAGNEGVFVGEMIGRHDAGPDRSGDAHVAEAHGHGPAAAAVAVRLDAVDLTDTGGQAEYHFAVGRGCGRRGRIRCV